MVEQAVARPGIAAHGLVGDEDVVRGAVDVVGRRAHGEGGRHGAAPRRAAHDVEHQAATAAAPCTGRYGPRSRRRRRRRQGRAPCRDEAVEPLDIADVVERHVVVHGDASSRRASAPCRRWARASRAAARAAVRRAAAARRPAAPAHWARSSAACQADGEHQVGLADGLLRPGRQLGVGDEQHVVVRASSALSARVASALSMGTRPAARRARHLRPHAAWCGCCGRNARVRPTRSRRQLAVAGTDQRDVCAGADRAAARG